MLLSYISNFTMLLLFCAIKITAASFYILPDSSALNRYENALILDDYFQLGFLQPGDSLLFTSGTYSFKQPLVINIKGTEKEIIYLGPASEDSVIFDGFYAFTHNDMSKSLYHRGMGIIHIDGAAHLKIEGLHVKNSRYHGITIRDSLTHHIELNGCSSNGSYAPGISVWYARHVKVFNCTVTGANNQDFRLPGVPLRREAPHEALTIAGARHFEVAYNSVFGNHKEGIDCKEVSAFGSIHHNHCYNNDRQGIYIDSWFGTLQDVEVYENISHNNGWGIVISAEDDSSLVKNIYIHHNLIYNNAASGVAILPFGYDAPRENIYIYNNTIYNNGSEGHWVGQTGGIDIRTENISNLFVFNNICARNYAFEIASFANPLWHQVWLKKKNISINYNLSADFKNIPPTDYFFRNVYGYLGENSYQFDPKIQLQEGHMIKPLPDSEVYRFAHPDPPAGKAHYLGAIKPD